MILSLKVIQVRQLLSPGKETAAALKEEKELRLTFVSLLPGFLAGSLEALSLALFLSLSDPGLCGGCTHWERQAEKKSHSLPSSELG